MTVEQRLRTGKGQAFDERQIEGSHAPGLCFARKQPTEYRSPILREENRTCSMFNQNHEPAIVQYANEAGSLLNSICDSPRIAVHARDQDQKAGRHQSLRIGL